MYTSTMATLALLIPLLFTLTTPISGAAINHPAARAQSALSDAAMAEMMTSLRVQAMKDTLRGLAELERSYPNFENPMDVLSEGGPKCATAGQSCNINAECCLPMTCRHHRALDLSRPNTGMTIGQCGIPY